MSPGGIAIVAWGSLVWDPRELRTRGPWNLDGPVLPIEFCRVARDGRLSLAIDAGYGVPVTCLWALSGSADLGATVENVRVREGMPDAGDVGFLDLGDGTASHDDPYVEVLRAWARVQRLDAVVWTALRTNFESDQRPRYSIEEAMRYLEGTEGEVRARAREYISRAPEGTDTPLRRAAVASGWLAR